MRDYIIHTNQPAPGYYWCRVKTGRGQYDSDNEVITKSKLEVEGWLKVQDLLPEAPEPVAEPGAEGVNR